MLAMILALEMLTLLLLCFFHKHYSWFCRNHYPVKGNALKSSLFSSLFQKLGDKEKQTLQLLWVKSGRNAWNTCSTFLANATFPRRFRKFSGNSQIKNNSSAYFSSNLNLFWWLYGWNKLKKKKSEKQQTNQTHTWRSPHSYLSNVFVKNKKGNPGVELPCRLVSGQTAVATARTHSHPQMHFPWPSVRGSCLEAPSFPNYQASFIA